jgi:hypothetical protein
MIELWLEQSWRFPFRETKKPAGKHCEAGGLEKQALPVPAIRF